MKLICETCISHRISNIKGRFQRCNLVLARKKDSDNPQIVVQSNKSQIHYDLKNNISNLFKRFIDEGKCTISFKVPEADLAIKADAIQLKAFLNAIKAQLYPEKSQGETTKTERPLQAANKLSNFNPANTRIETKLVITSRAGFHTKGFPRTLKQLTINNVGCSQMPISILNLSNLTHLDLSNNNIERLPKNAGNLRLSSLILDNNQFYKSNACDWIWLENRNIKKSLKHISLSTNKLEFFPPNLTLCSNLVQMDLRSNSIKKLPASIRSLAELKFLNISNNQVRSVPYNLMKLKLQAIDISGMFTHKPPMEEYGRTLAEEDSLRVQTLFDLAATVITKKRIPFKDKNIPKILKDVLATAPLCINSNCEKVLFMKQFRIDAFVAHELPAKEVCKSNSVSEYLVYGPTCSQSCSKSLNPRQRNVANNPVA